MSTVQIKKHGDEYYVDINDFIDIVDISLVDTYETEFNEETGELMVTFFDKDGKQLALKGKQ